MLFWHVPAPNEALLISGSKRQKDGTQFRIVTGHGSFVVPVKQKARVLSLALREAEIVEECITNQGIVWCRNAPEKHDGLSSALGYCGNGVTNTERAEMDSTTTMRRCRGIGSSDQAAKASEPPRTGSNTSPGPSAGMDTVTRPTLPIRLS